MNTQENRNVCFNIVKEMERDFQENPGLILTESDLQCILHHKLSNYFVPQRTYEGYLASMVHSEVKWYNAERLLRPTPDITISDPQHLELFVPRLERHKGFYGNGPSILLELKFFRSLTGPDAGDRGQLREDFENIDELFNLHANNQDFPHHCFFVALNRTNIQQRIILGDYINYCQHNATPIFIENTSIIPCTGNVLAERDRIDRLREA